MRWLRVLRYSSIGVFCMSVISLLQGCSVKDAATAALILFLLGLPSCEEPFTKIYITNLDNSRVVVANLDGSGAQNLGNLGRFLDRPFGIALDIRADKMYVTSGDNNRVVVANLDGSEAQNLGNLGGFFAFPIGIALDIRAGKMYVVSVNNNLVVVANLDGSGAQNLGNLGGRLDHPSDLALSPK